MSMLARYKKGSGIIELIKLIEDSVEPKRTQLLTMIRNEDPEFASQVESRIFTFDMLKVLPENVVAEIIAACPAKIVAISLVGETDKNWVTLVDKCIGKNFNELKAEKEAITGQPPNPTQIDAAKKKLVSEARKLDSEGKIKLNQTSASPAASTGEEGVTPPTPVAPAANVDPAPTKPAASKLAPIVGSAMAEDGCPPLESFGIEAPPPGLAGERLETFIKSQIEK